MTILTRRSVLRATTIVLLSAALTAPLRAGVQDYEFQLVQGEVKKGDGTIIAVRLVDKRSGKEVYLDGSWAELFQQQIAAWQLKTPTQEEVEDTLEGYAELAQTPVLMH